MKRRMIKKNTHGVSIIGGSDGPTSIFIAGKSKKIPLKERISRFFYERKRGRAEKTVIANPHTLEDVIQYLQDTYGAVEISKESHAYQEQYKCLKESLIMQHKPEAEGISDDMFPMDFHVYKIALSGVGEMQFGIDTVWNIFGSSYSGSKKGMKQLNRISKDVHLYYGVTEEDIKSKSDRYSSLVTTLCI